MPLRVFSADRELIRLRVSAGSSVVSDESSGISGSLPFGARLLAALDRARFDVSAETPRIFDASAQARSR